MRLLKRVLRTLLIMFAAFAAVAAVEYGVRRPYTPTIEATGAALPISSLETVPIRGVPQSVLIRGHDRTKPILLFLHGGPGMPVMFLAHAFQRKLERDFLIVHWDRRGAGKSYAAFSEETASVRSTLDDLYALTTHLRERFRTDQVYLVGHSWGTYLGLLAAHERPELFTAYIGAGQMAADAARIREARAGFFRREAAARGDQEMLQRLARADTITEDDLFRYGAELRGSESFWPIVLTGLRAPEYTLNDVMNVRKGSERLGQRMRYDVLSRPLDESLLDFRIPIYFFLGRHDWNEPSVLAAEYLRRIRAPSKGLVWFEESAHFPFLEEPERFRCAMSALVVALSTKATRELTREHNRVGSPLCPCLRSGADRLPSATSSHSAGLRACPLPPIRDIRAERPILHCGYAALGYRKCPATTPWGHREYA